MNRKPNTQGISRRWVPGEDDRVLVAEATGLGERTVDRFFDGLWRVLSTQRRTKIVGFGVFEWKRWRNRLPTGRMSDVMRLVFKPSRYTKRYGR